MSLNTGVHLCEHTESPGNGIQVERQRQNDKDSVVKRQKAECGMLICVLVGGR